MSEKSAEAEFNSETIRAVGYRDIEYLKTMALRSARKRYRLCLHHDQSHATQEMIICLNGFNYFAPHLHPGNRSESYHLIEGVMDVYLLENNGNVIDVVRLAAPGTPDAETRKFMYRLSGPVFHLMVPRSEWTVYHEVLTGPWTKEGVVRYAPFAPSDGNVEAGREYVRRITEQTVIAESSSKASGHRET